MLELNLMGLCILLSNNHNNHNVLIAIILSIKLLGCMTSEFLDSFSGPNYIINIAKLCLYL